MSKKCLVIGGGFAGLSAAVFLSKKNFHVTLVETSPKLGGRAYSLLDNNTNTIIDNGQHILMGCYYETLKFLVEINAQDNFIYQKKLEVNFLTGDGKYFKLKSASLIYPLSLIFGLINYKPLSISERFSLLKLLLKIPFIASNDLKEISVYDWLIQNKQSENTRKCFWDVIAIGALNTNTKKASAKIFVDILKQIFSGGNKSSTIVLPKFGLSESYCKNAEEYIIKNRGEIKLSESVNKVTVNNNFIVEVKTSHRTYNDFDYVISAVPHFAFNKIFEDEIINNVDFEYSSIVNIHIWLIENNLQKDFYALIDSPVHWIFNKADHLNLVISDADYLTEKPNEEIFKIAADELEKFISLKKENISGYKVIKEKRATFVPSKEVISKRPSQKTKLKNLIIAGDWVNTGLPSTIESAVKSGRTAGEMVLENSNYKPSSESR